MKIMKRLSLWMLSFLILVAGCQSLDTQSLDQYDTKNIHEGKGLKALYKKQGANQRDENNPLRSIFPQASDDLTGLDGNHELGRTPEPGTKMARDTIPFGYVERSHQDPVVIQSGYGANIHIDREVLADAVAQIVVGLHNVTDSAVLVTDDECIIGYRAHQTGENMQQQVELAGQSVTPRWFKVYATNDYELVQSIKEVTRKPSGERLGRQLNHQVDFIIQQLGGPKESWEQPIIPNESRQKEPRGMNKQAQPNQNVQHK